MEPNGTNVRQLTSDAGQQPIVHTGDYWLTSNYSPAWAPSGDVIAYVHLGVRYTTSIRLIDPDGRFVGTVTDDFRLHTSPAYSPLLSWSPDGDRLAFSGSQTNGGPEDLWTIRIDGTDPQRVVVDSGSSRGLYHIRDVSWSPRGDLIAFSARNVEHGRAAVHVVAPDGSNLRMIDCGINFGIETEWSPNGRLLYCSESSMGTVWATTMPQGSSTFPAVSFAGDRAQPTASPDGLQLLHVSDYALWSDNPKSRIEAFSGGT
jgi:TolB protein